jgi:hypothetical protein
MSESVAWAAFGLVFVVWMVSVEYRLWATLRLFTRVHRDVG